MRYAFAVRALTAYDVTTPCSELSCPALFTARRHDRVVGYRNSQRVAELVAGSQFTMVDGGHYAVFTDTGAPARIARFMLSA